jgi:hypothetical protein
VQAVRKTLAERLLEMYRRTSSSDWRWFEDGLAYCNARLPQALIVSGASIDSAEMTKAGLESLEWLSSVQRSADGCFAPVGSLGFQVRGGPKALFDQQPVEACSMISACIEALRFTGDDRWGHRAWRAFNWFSGQNVLRESLYDVTTGGCRDGLHADRVNENQGAESTLSYLLALLEMRAVDRPAKAGESIVRPTFLPPNGASMQTGSAT